MTLIYGLKNDSFLYCPDEVLGFSGNSFKMLLYLCSNGWTTNPHYKLMRPWIPQEICLHFTNTLGRIKCLSRNLTGFLKIRWILKKNQIRKFWILFYMEFAEFVHGFVYWKAAHSYHLREPYLYLSLSRSPHIFPFSIMWLRVEGVITSTWLMD